MNKERFLEIIDKLNRYSPRDWKNLEKYDIKLYLRLKEIHHLYRYSRYVAKNFIETIPETKVISFNVEKFENDGTKRSERLTVSKNDPSYQNEKCNKLYEDLEKFIFK